MNGFAKLGCVISRWMCLGEWAALLLCAPIASMDSGILWCDQAVCTDGPYGLFHSLVCTKLVALMANMDCGIACGKH